MSDSPDPGNKPDKCNICGSDYAWDDEAKDWYHIESLIGH